MMFCYTPDGRSLLLDVPSTSVIVRWDGRIDWVCRHGVEHPIGHRERWEAHHGIHGCDGCKPPAPLFKES